ncbi:MAG: hypothetical protein ACRD3T_22195, partial [Terriglobia bacterium]
RNASNKTGTGGAPQRTRVRSAVRNLFLLKVVNLQLHFWDTSPKIVPEKASQLRVRFKGAFCYIDAEEPGAVEPSPLCRMRYMASPDRWTLAFYTYSNEKYEPCVFMSGDFFGTPEEALEIGAVYLR